MIKVILVNNKGYVEIPELKESSCFGCCFYAGKNKLEEEECSMSDELFESSELDCNTFNRENGEGIVFKLALKDILKNL